MGHIWDDVISKEDMAVYEKCGFSGRHVGMGKKPALIIIDVQYRTVGDNVPIMESMLNSGYNMSCGERAWACIPHIQRMANLAREKGFPVIYCMIERSNAQDAGRWADKAPGLASGDTNRAGSKGVEAIEELKMQKGDIYIPKRYPSGFFGTHLATQLITLGCDTVIVTGCTTSGCIRATAVDAFSYGFRVIVPENAVYDRIDITHKINLFDLNQKYADVIPTDEVLEQIKSR